MDSDSQLEAFKDSPKLSTRDCGRLKYKNQWRTEVRCKGTVVLKPSLVDAYLTGKCNLCGWGHHLRKG